MKGKGVATNRNELGVELKSKNSKIQSGDVKVVVCANKMARSEFLKKLRTYELTNHALLG